MKKLLKLRQNLKQQKKDLLTQLDDAISKAPDENGWYPRYQKAPKYYETHDKDEELKEYAERVKAFGIVSFTIQGTQYRIINTKPRLEFFKKSVKKKFPISLKLTPPGTSTKVPEA